MTAETNSIVQELDRISALCNKRDELQGELLAADLEKDSKNEEALQRKTEKAKAFEMQKRAELPQPGNGVNLEGENAPAAVEEWVEFLVNIERSAGKSKWVPIDYRKHLASHTWSILASWMGIVSLIVCVIVANVSVLFLYLTLVLGVACLFAGCFLNNAQLKLAKERLEQRNEEKAKHDEKTRKWEKASARYISDFYKTDRTNVIKELIDFAESYDKEFLRMVADCDTALEEINQGYNRKLQENQYMYEKDTAAINADIAKNNAEIEKVTLIHPELFDKAEKISTALKMGRTESLSEAINLVLEDERREAEEAARQAEAYRREQLLQQQIEENRLHNQQMEIEAREAARQAREHNEAMERQARQAQQEADKQRERDREEADQLLKRRKKDAERRCWNCANSGSCSMMVKSGFFRTGDICPSYRPK